MSDAHCNNLAQRKALGLITHDNTGGPFVVECHGCGAVYPSFQCRGGGQIADTGDYNDAHCPHCGHADPEECENVGLTWNTQQLKINELQQRLTAADEQIDLLSPRHTEQPEGKRERFEKWVMATKHPVYGFLDGRSLARGDDRTGYADEYVQGLWVAYLAFGVEQSSPVVMPKLEMAHVVRAHLEIPGCPVLTSNQCHALAMKLSACLDEVSRLSAKSR